MKTTAIALFICVLITAAKPAYPQETGSDYIHRYGNEKPPGFYLEKPDSRSFTVPTFVKFGIPDTSKIRINIYDAYGKELEVLDNIRLSGGKYIFDWQLMVSDSEKFKSGFYFFHMYAELDRIPKQNFEMEFKGSTRLILVR